MNLNVVAIQLLHLVIDDVTMVNVSISETQLIVQQEVYIHYLLVRVSVFKVVHLNDKLVMMEIEGQ